MTYYQVIDNALAGKRGVTQELIAKTGCDIVALLLQKNADYNDSVFKSPTLAPSLAADIAIRVRMSDKISRLSNLLSKDYTQQVNESVEDTFKDLAGYCILWLTLQGMDQWIAEIPNDSAPETGQ